MKKKRTKVYSCRQARKDVRFAYSKKAEETPELIREAFERFLSHALCRDNKTMSRCSSCLAYHHELKERDGF